MLLPSVAALLQLQALAVEPVVVAIPKDFVMDSSIHDLFAQLTSVIYEHGDERTKVLPIHIL